VLLAPLTTPAQPAETTEHATTRRSPLRINQLRTS
jgi:hypothetical protein